MFSARIVNKLFSTESLIAKVFITPLEVTSSAIDYNMCLKLRSLNDADLTAEVV
jgi:hypothetical protein